MLVDMGVVNKALINRRWRASEIACALRKIIVGGLITAGVDIFSQVL